MGWDYFPGKSKNEGISIMLDRLSFQGSNSTHKLEMHEKVGNVIYCVSSAIGEECSRYASVIVVRKDVIGIGYKCLHESEHPFYYDMPKELFNTLTPASNKYAREWRTKVFNILFPTLEYDADKHECKED